MHRRKRSIAQVPMISSTDIARVFQERSADLEGRLNSLPDKPAENVASTLRALWHLAAGTPLSADAANGTPLPPLDTGAEATLSVLIEKRVSGVPLAHLTGR